jgi:hypothetical protein
MTFHGMRIVNSVENIILGASELEITPCGPNLTSACNVFLVLPRNPISLLLRYIHLLSAYVLAGDTPLVTQGPERPIFNVIQIQRCIVSESAKSRFQGILNDVPVAHHDNPVIVDDGVQPVRNGLPVNFPNSPRWYQQSCPLEFLLDCNLDLGIRLVIDATRRFIHDDYFRFPNKGARHGE